MIKVDLHTHTKFSDGDCDILELLSLAKRQSLKELAITDHDCIDGISVCENSIHKYGIRIVPGIESSTNVKGVHILGYGIKNVDAIKVYLKSNEEYNFLQDKRTIDALYRQGIDISLSKVYDFSKKDHITYKDIAKFLTYNGYATDYADAYRNFIGKGSFAYFPSYQPTMEECLNLIRNCGAVASLAHANTISKNLSIKHLLEYLIEKGLKAIEVCNIKSGLINDSEIVNLANEYKLIKTWGSDFHDKRNDTLGVEVPENDLDKFNEMLEL